MTWPRNKYPRSKGGLARDKLKKTARWRRKSKAFLEAHPLCRCPHCTGGRAQARPSNIVHHVKSPIVGDRVDHGLFWDQANWLAMNKGCHDTFAQSAEKGGHGFMKGNDEAGYPLNPAHHWYA